MTKYSIGEFARLIGVSAMTLRRWDKRGVFVADRSPLGNRQYMDEHLERYKKMVKPSDIVSTVSTKRG